MATLALIAATTAQGFFRCGMFFPEKGEVVDLDALDDGVFERLKAEPRLRITEPTEDDLAQFAAVDAEGEAELRFSLMEAIRDLEAEDFQKDGKPRMEALKSHLPKGTKLTAADRDAVWDEMVEGGFAAPAG